MKRLLLLAVLCGFSFGSFAQASKENAVMKKDGKMMMIKDGKASEMKEDFITANGHMYKTDGTIIFNTGSTTQLKEGEKIDMNGNKVPAAAQSSNSKK